MSSSSSSSFPLSPSSLHAVLEAIVVLVFIAQCVKVISIVGPNGAIGLSLLGSMIYSFLTAMMKGFFFSKEPHFLYGHEELFIFGCSFVISYFFYSFWKSRPLQILLYSAYSFGKARSVYTAVNAPVVSFGGGLYVGLFCAISGDMYLDLLQLFVKSSSTQKVWNFAFLSTFFSSLVRMEEVLPRHSLDFLKANLPVGVLQQFLHENGLTFPDVCLFLAFLVYFYKWVLPLLLPSSNPSETQKKKKSE